MELKSLQDLGALKTKLRRGLVEESVIAPLEERIGEYLKQEGLDGFDEISATEIALDLHKSGYSDLDELYGYFSLRHLESRDRISSTFGGFQQYLERNNFPINASLGLILTGSDIFREVKSILL